MSENTVRVDKAAEIWMWVLHNLAAAKKKRKKKKKRQILKNVRFWLFFENFLQYFKL